MREPGPGWHRPRSGPIRASPKGHGSAARSAARPGKRPRSAPGPARAPVLTAAHRPARPAWLAPGPSGAMAYGGAAAHREAAWQLRMLDQGLWNPAADSTAWPEGDMT